MLKRPWDVISQEPIKSKGNAPSDPWSVVSVEPISTPDFTSNPKGEGLYRMSNSQPEGAWIQQNEIQVPFSRVEDAIKSGYKLHFDDAPRYKKDFEGQGKGPSLWEQVKSKFQSATEPTQGWKGEIPATPFQTLNQYKAMIRTVAGVPEYLGQVLNAAYKQASGQGDLWGTELMDLIDPTKMPEQMYNKLQSDRQQYGDRIATDNLIGTIEGLGIVAVATHGAQKGVGNIALKGTKAMIRTPRATLEAVTDTSPRQIREIAEEVQRKNADAIKVAADKNVDKAQEHLEKSQEALHKTQGTELETEAANKAAIEKSQADHASEVAKVNEHNQRVQSKHKAVSERIQQENAAAEHALELRHAEEAKLEQETTDYYAKEDAVKVKVKKAADAKWTPVHTSLDAKTIDGGYIETPLSKILEISPDVRREISQLIPDPEDAEPTSPYVKARNKILKSMGHKDPQAAYDKLVDFRKAQIEKILEQEGITPDPIDLEPKSGVEIPFDKIHRAQSIIGRNIRNGRYGYEGPLLGEMKQLQKVLYNAESKIAADNGMSSDLDEARQATREYQEAFGRQRNTPKNQADLRKQQANPEQFKEENEQERVDAAKKHDPTLAADYEKVKAHREAVKKMQTEEQLRKAQKQIPPPPTVNDLREGYRLKPVPIPPEPKVILPERTAPPDRPPEVIPDTKTITPEDYKAKKIENIKASAKTLRSMGLRRAMYATMTGLPFAVVELFKGVGATGAGEAALGGLAAGGVVLAGSHMLANLIELPEVSAWLSNITDKDIAIWNKLPSEQKALFTQDMKQLEDAAKTEGIKVSPVMSAWLAGTSASRNQKNTPHIDDVKKKAEDLQNEFHKSGLAPAPAPAEGQGPQSFLKPTHIYNATKGIIEAA